MTEKDKLCYKIYHCSDGWYAIMEKNGEREKEYETDIFPSRCALFFDLADGRTGWYCDPKREERR